MSDDSGNPLTWAADDERRKIEIQRLKEELELMKAKSDHNFDTALAAADALEKVEKRLDSIIQYCKPHLDHMWAAYIVGIVLGIDFRDAKHEVEKYELRKSQVR